MNERIKHTVVTSGKKKRAKVIKEGRTPGFGLQDGPLREKENLTHG